MNVRFRLQRILVGALPFAGAALILTLLFRRVPPARMLDALSGVDLFLFLAALLPVSLCYVLLDGVLLMAVLRWFHPPGVHFREALAVRAVDYLVSLWNGRVSQAAMVGTLGRRFGAGGADGESHPGSGYWECAGTILFLDLCQRAHLLFWAAAGALALGSAAPDHVPVAAGLGFAGLCLLVAFLRGRLRAAGLGPPRWRLLQSLRRAAPRHYLAVFALKAPLIAAAAVGHHFALEAFGIRIPVGVLVATLPIIFLAGALPIAVARIGTSQAAWLYFHTGAAAASPGGEAGLLAYSFAAHLTFLVLNAALSAPFLPAAWRAIRGAAHPGSPDAGPPGETPDAPFSRAAGRRSAVPPGPLSVAS